MEPAWSPVYGRGNTARPTVLVMCTAIMAIIWVLLLILSSMESHSTHAYGPPAAQASATEVSIQVTDIAPSRLAAGLNITLQDLAASQHTGSGSSTLRLAIGSLLHTFPLQHAQAMTARAVATLTEVAGRHLNPFDAYSLSLSPLTAELRLCEPGNDADVHSAGEQGPSGGSMRGSSAGGGDTSGGSSSSSSNSNSMKSSSSISTTSSASTTSSSCTRVSMPIRVVFDLGSVPGFKIQRRHLAHIGGGALAGDLLITRATSQRVLRLMAHLLQRLGATYLAGKWAAAVVLRWLMRRFFFRRMHPRGVRH